MSARRPLDVIQIPNPCPVPWEQMKGGDQRRFCSHCNKLVHNLSAMPVEEAERLVCSDAGNLCVRFARDVRTNEFVSLNYAPRPLPSRRRALLTIASILGAFGFSTTWAAVKFLKQPAPPTPPPTPNISYIAGAIAEPQRPIQSSVVKPPKAPTGHKH